MRALPEAGMGNEHHGTAADFQSIFEDTLTVTVGWRPQREDTSNGRSASPGRSRTE